MDIEQSVLPGIGVRYGFVTESGSTVSLIVHRGGRQELGIADPGDPDRVRDVLVLTPEEGDALAELLGAPRLVEHIADLHREIKELVTEHVVVPASSGYAGRPLGETRMRTRTGASAVAVVRDRHVIASPGPEQVLEAGDVVVVIGTMDGTRAAASLFEQ